MGLGNTVKFAQVALGLVPEVLEAVAVVFAGGKQLGMIDPPMPQAGDSQRIVAGQRVTINDGVRHNPFLSRWATRSSPWHRQ